MHVKKKGYDELVQNLKSDTDQHQDKVLYSAERIIKRKEHRKYIVTLPGKILREAGYKEGDSIRFELISKEDKLEVKATFSRKHHAK